ncbi:unnamed protein product (macronuclear) [Paramecium tetraurelia]|uniref:Ubiquitin-like domain-containing protein n=1 Tax=Paramecium tetraurelia TaxID=5888 RepID=A0EB55_PARTE|nr:uncharacterized protein GSPATT00025256001 [Paramecium tetraurelia]CAK92522.1 unnamed protein product [Paramecium tetraurelia]|eukprot:XP_001459919.1 hypothetical protein (macronuclear) [Paramecium tetraurelia strain d4-2]
MLLSINRINRYQNQLTGSMIISISILVFKPRFLKGENKNNLQILNKNKKQTFRSSNQLVSSCINDSDVLVINEVESEVSFLELNLDYDLQRQKIHIQDDITIQELIEFIYGTFSISLDIKLEIIYENLILSNQKRIKKLADLQVPNGANIKIIPIYKLDNNLINLQIICKDSGSSQRRSFQKSDTLNAVINSAQGYLGLDENTVGFKVFIKSKNYKGDANKDRNKTLSYLKLEDDDIVEIKILYSGGR